jgi:hypothetical protein
MNALNVLDWKRNAEGDIFFVSFVVPKQRKNMQEKYSLDIAIAFYIHCINIFERFSVEMLKYSWFWSGTSHAPFYRNLIYIVNYVCN